MFMTVIAELLPQLQRGRARPIAVTSAKRVAQFPNLPTIGDTVPGYEFTSWFGIFVPAGTPRPIVDKLNAELKKAVTEHDVIASLNAQAADPMYMTPEEFAGLLKAEYDKYEKVVKISGARLD
jgi:tripartite-type tricarboxylate transporter receptor subunit TctC